MTAKKTDAQTDAQQAAQPATLTVTGPVQGRWRAGRRFGPAATVLVLDELTEAEITLIQADPMLVTSLDPVSAEA
jgi:hypothetical protein